MKHLVALCAAIAILAVAPTAPARADSVSDLAAIQTVYNNRCALALVGDFDGFTKTMTDDYQATDASGQVENREQIVADMEAVLATVKLATCAVTAGSPIANADGSTTVRAIATQTGSTAVGGTTTPLVMRGTVTDVWVLRGGSWLLKSSTEVEMTVTANGQVIQHEGGASPAPAPSASP